MKKTLVFIFLFLIGMCFNNQVAHAYPNYIRLGYSSCIGCHYNPAGGGMLTPYGKGISSTQSFNSSELSEDEEEKLSSAKYLQAFQGRVLDYKTSAKNRIFPMQAEYFGRYEINPKWKVNFSIAVAPKPESSTENSTPKTYQRTYARNLEASLVQDKNHYYFLGISPLPIGIGLVDHTNFVRANNRLQITDIPLNFRSFVYNDKYTYNYFVFVPHYLEKVGNRESGIGGQYWYLPTKNISLGFQALIGSTSAINRKLGGLLLKGGIKEFSYLGELNYTHRFLKEDQNQFGQITHYNQFTFHPKDWFNIGYAFSGISKDRDFFSSEIRHSLLVQAKILRSTTLLYETRLRRYSGQNEVSHLIQGFFQWW